MSDWSRIAKFAGLLGSTSDGEIVNAARMIDKELKAQGLSWADFVQRLGGVARPAGDMRTAAERYQDNMRYSKEVYEAWNARMREDEERQRQRRW